MRAAPVVLALLVAGLATACAGAPGGPSGAAITVPPPAPADARSTAFALVADASGPTARATGAPGGEAVLAVRLANASDTERTLALRAGAPWLSVASPVTVPPRQSVPVRVVARVPADAPAVLRSEVVARAEGDRAATVSVSYESSVPVVVSVRTARR